MGTEIALSFSALRAQLESEKSSLYKIDENIKKIVQTSGRFQNDRFNSSGDYSRGGPRPGGRNFQDNGKNEDLFGKRKHETKTVFSRLSARAGDSEGEEEGAGGPVKRTRMVSAVCRELPTRAAVLRAQGGDEQARTRNRRIFGSLLGTLQKFKQEEIGLQNKEEKKAQVERKIEEQARLEKEREQKERKNLFAVRDQKKATIKALEAKMGRVAEYEKWEASQKSLGNFILTKSKPHVYWLPKKMSDKANEKLMSSRKYHEKCMQNKRQELEEELKRIEMKCLRRGPGAKENDPDTTEDTDKPHDTQTDNTAESEQDDKGRKRDKFAIDMDEKEKEDSDGEDRHEHPKEGDNTECKDEEMDSKEADNTMDESVDQNSTAQECEETEPEDKNTTMEIEKTVELLEKPEAHLETSGDVSMEHPEKNDIDNPDPEHS